MKRFILVSAFALVVAACGGSTGVEPASDVISNAPAATDAAGSSDSGDDGSGGPTAPDFSLALGEGGTFTLSAEEKPVYMVFWAEW